MTRLNERPWFWLSFADPRKPKGKQFLGAIVIQASDFPAAVGKSHRLEINPGGECRGYQFDPRENMARFMPFINRLLSMKEIIENNLGESTTNPLSLN